MYFVLWFAIINMSIRRLDYSCSKWSFTRLRNLVLSKWIQIGLGFNFIICNYKYDYSTVGLICSTCTLGFSLILVGVEFYFVSCFAIINLSILRLNCVVAHGASDSCLFIISFYLDKFKSMFIFLLLFLLLNMGTLWWD